jgi:hypothetical protein
MKHKALFYGTDWIESIGGLQAKLKSPFENTVKSLFNELLGD